MTVQSGAEGIVICLILLFYWRCPSEYNRKLAVFAIALKVRLECGVASKPFSDFEVAREFIFAEELLRLHNYVDFARLAIQIIREWKKRRKIHPLEITKSATKTSRRDIKYSRTFQHLSHSIYIILIYFFYLF